MLRDFGSDTLPVDSSHTFDASRNRQLVASTWPRINGAAAHLLFECMKGPAPTGGWMKVDDEIAVLMLPSKSLMRFYWANDLVKFEEDGRHQTTTMRKTFQLSIRNQN